jgi:hypothetical protein
MLLGINFSILELVDVLAEGECDGDAPVLHPEMTSATLSANTLAVARKIFFTELPFDIEWI